MKWYFKPITIPKNKDLLVKNHILLVQQKR